MKYWKDIDNETWADAVEEEESTPLAEFPVREKPTHNNAMPDFGTIPIRPPNTKPISHKHEKN